VFLGYSIVGSVTRAELPPIIGVIHADTPNVLFGVDIAPIMRQGYNHSDLLIGNGRFSNYLYRGGANFDTMPFLRFDSCNRSFMGSIGDINADSYDDFGMLGRSSYGWKYNVFDGGNVLDTLRDFWFGLDTFTAQGPATICHSLLGDGREILVSPGQANFRMAIMLFATGTAADSSPILILRPYLVPPIQAGSFAQDIAIGDYNGDGISDIAAGFPMRESALRPGEVWLYFGGHGFDTIPDLIIRRSGPFEIGQQVFGVSVECPGDLNGDGFSDLIVGGSLTDTNAFVYFGGQSIDTIPDIVLFQDPEIIRWAGDVSGDGYPDFIVSTPLPFSSGNRVQIYYGGPAMDGNPDLTIWDWEIPGYHTLFGAGCTGVGDFNGDGSQDFAFFLFDNLHNGQVYIFSGQKPTDVPFSHDPALPSGFTLRQNYPNPFNPSTTIECELAKPSRVTLEIYNSLGQQVRTLVDRPLSVGVHRVQWDGRDDQGNTMSSGVYLYRLVAGYFSQERKMVLVR
jgi:hypothetical protein